MVAKFLLVPFMAVAVLGAPHPDSHPSYGPPPSYHAPSYQAPSYHAPSYKEPGMPYAFAYAVKDDYKGVDFGHDESNDGHVTSGSYRVALPDGRTQIVTFTASDETGYVAEVTYIGEARYPETKPYAPHAPAYGRPAYA
ncbi:unnamed protein product [Meganyctiphanes norvegica]|uniref:Cuticle protein n=1 Tax=Meganyctiphanes norvegica TaxID=48144 RepID=A0AAV2QJZ0_MEGNR